MVTYIVSLGYLNSGKWNLILTPLSRQLKFYFLVKKSVNHPPQLIFNGSAVVQVTEQKHLGLTLEPGLSFEKHISEKIIKAKKNIGILKHEIFTPKDT